MPGFAASFTCNDITVYDAKCAVDPERTSAAECLAMEFASKYSAQLHRRSPDRRSFGDGTCLIAIQLPTQPSDRLNVPAPAFPDNRPTALRVMPFPAPTECNVPSGSTCPLPPRTTIFPSIISATNEPVCRHPALVNVEALVVLLRRGARQFFVGSLFFAPGLGKER
jgi:hypothetical protein